MKKVCKSTFLSIENSYYYFSTFQVELTGSSIFDYVHTHDHAELAEQLGVTLANNQRISPTSASMSPDVPEGLTGTVNHGASPAIPDGKPCK